MEWKVLLNPGIKTSRANDDKINNQTASIIYVVKTIGNINSLIL